MKYDLDISVDEKLSRLSNASQELLDNASDYVREQESTWPPSHVADYENWKMTNKRNKR